MRPWKYSAVVLPLLFGLTTAMGPKDTIVAQRRTEDAEYFEYELSSFSLRFEKCQYVKSYDDEIAEDEDSETVLATKHFVVFKICPSDECETCDGVHGEYVTTIEEYLQATVEYEQQEFENMCENCNERCNNDGDYCSGCGKICYQWANLEANGYVDASEYIECQKLDIQNDDDNQDEENDVYIGPRCTSGGSVSIGIFSDEDCLEPVDGADVEELLGSKLSYHVLSNVISDDDGDKVCLSCAEADDDDDNEDNQDDADQVNEMCEEVYAAAAKCESIHGLDDGFVNVNREDEDYENQVENEFMVCTFINSLIWNSYTETGEINIFDEQDEIIRELTPLQTFSLSALGISILAFAGYAYYLYNAIEKAYPSVTLSAQGDGQVA